MRAPLRCELWKSPEATLARGMEAGFLLVHTVAKESHWWRHVLKCRDCGQLYVYEFTEEIDWADGEDPQFATWVPVETDAELAAARAAPPGGLARFVPRLCKDWPKGKARPTLRRVTAAAP